MTSLESASAVAEGSEPPQTNEERRYYALNRRVYPFFAPFYDAVVFPIRRLRQRVAAAARVDASSRVLDVATGTGAQALAFAERGAEVIGIDLAESMLRIARKKRRSAKLAFQQGDATNLPFSDASFDVSCVSFALHEMPSSIRERTLAEMVRVTKSGGTIVVVDYARPPGAFGDVVFNLVKLYEREPYVDFIGSDLLGLLKRSGIVLKEDRAELLGAVRITIGRNAR